MSSRPTDLTEKVGKLRVCSCPVERRLEPSSQAAPATISVLSAIGISACVLATLAAIKLVVINPDMLKEAFSLPIAVESTELESEREQSSRPQVNNPITPPPALPRQVSPQQVVPAPTVPLFPASDLVIEVPDMAEALEEIERLQELEKEEERKKLAEEQQRLAQLEIEQQREKQRQEEAKARKKREQEADAKRRAALAKTSNEANRRAALTKKVTANPSVTRRISPVYPRSARASGLQGTTRILATITTSGKVASPRVVTSSGHRSLDSAALAAVRKWRFSPAKNGIGQAIAQQITIPVSFRLN